MRKNIQWLAKIAMYICTRGQRGIYGCGVLIEPVVEFIQGRTR